MAIFLLMLLTVGCTPPAGLPGPTVGGASGIRGRVVLGPTCPTGQSPGEYEAISCLTPYAAQLVVLDDENNAVARVSSTADGHFEIELPPGEYVIAPQPGDPYPVAQPVTVTVAPGQFAPVEINYDTGIR